MSFAHILPPHYKREVIQWLEDDCPSFDVGGFVVGEKEEIALLYCKTDGAVLAGVPFADAIFDHLGIAVTWYFKEGEVIHLPVNPDTGKRVSKVVIAEARGKCRHLLLAERTVLNTMSRASGVAGAARKACEIKERANWHGYVAGTRKTTPGFRTVEKYALIVGGAATHRLDLSQMVMLKDNHIWSCGSITKAVQTARQGAGFSMKIEVECQSLDDGLEAAAAGADVVMLDNFTSETIHDVAAAIKREYPHVLIEASGVRANLIVTNSCNGLFIALRAVKLQGISEESMAGFMSPYIDVISRGSLTQGSPLPHSSRSAMSMLTHSVLCMFQGTRVSTFLSKSRKRNAPRQRIAQPVFLSTS